MGVEFDCVATLQCKDSQGETLMLDGADISELEAGRGIINDNHSNTLVNVLGRVISAKKIYKPEDCEDDRQKYYWDKIKTPYLYAKAELFPEHRAAEAAAAILKYSHFKDSPLRLRCSVEGGIVERGNKDTTVLSKTKIRGIALTFTPANHSTLVEGLTFQKANPSLKEINLMKSVIPYAVDNVPALVDLSTRMVLNQISSKINEATMLIKALKSEKKKNEKLGKAMTCGFGGGGEPGALVSGGVITKESIKKEEKKPVKKELKYLSCDKCGKDQIYGKYQVKCRHCNKPLDLETLYPFLAKD
jgi:hypothetical protein